MPIGPLVRRAFGPYEPQVAEAWRAIFVDLDRCADQILTWVPQASRILEVGCGEGSMTERLVARYPNAEIMAIDVTPRIGRLFRGDRNKVSFLQVPVETVGRERGGDFDLVVLSDVLHHVPLHARDSLMSGIGEALAPEGSFVFKEWIRTNSPIHLPMHWLCAASDRFITGDEVSYITAAEARALLGKHFRYGTIVAENPILPWANNHAFLLKNTPPRIGAPP